MWERFTLFPVCLREKELIVFSFFDSSVCTVTVFMLEDCGSICGMGFCLTQIDFLVSIACCLMGRLPGAMRLELQTDHSPHHVPGLRMHGALSPPLEDLFLWRRRFLRGTWQQ
jgi:hypothetical protein